MTMLRGGFHPVDVPAGVYAPQHDSELLIQVMQRTLDLRDRSVLDLCTGSGVVAIAAARRGARPVVAVDICADAVRCARSNAAEFLAEVDVRIGDCRDALHDATYDVVLANPPYVPTGPESHRDRIPREAGPCWAWNAGPDGRLVIDPICDTAPALLARGGTLLLVQSEFAHPDQTLSRLRRGNLNADIVARQSIPFGPVLSARAAWLERAGALRTGRRVEQLVVIRARKPNGAV